MKKIIIYIACLIIMCTGCSPKKDVTIRFQHDVLGSPVQLEVDGTGSAFKFDWREQVDNVEETKTVTVLDKTYSAEYMETRYMVDLNTSWHKYQMSDAPESVERIVPSVYYSIDTGELLGYSGFDIAAISANENTTREELETAIENVFGDWIDFSKYNKFEEVDLSHIYSYGYVWYIAYNGYEAPTSLEVIIKENKLFKIIKYNSPYTEESDFTFSKTEEELDTIIENALNERFNTDTTEYKSYEIEQQHLVEHEGKKSMCYTLSVKYNDEEDGERTAGLCYLLVTP